MASKSDIQVASLAAGFTIGFGFLTVWEAMKQTRRNKNPLRSIYIYMVWGEIAANLAIGIVGWLFLGGTLGPTVPVLFFILFLWVFEIQLLMQIIINRIALIAEHRSTVKKIKYGTAAAITAVNIAVFCIWIPAHMNPPVSETYVLINKYWDRTSKVIILIVDAALNWYFLRTVQHRLVQQHGLVKYKPLVGFNAKLMVVSIAMDVMLIGLMSLPNQVVYIQFHPVAYMVKLNIEMSMASLVVRLARGTPDNDMYVNGSISDPRSHQRSMHAPPIQSFPLTSTNGTGLKKHHANNSDESNFGGIHCRTDLAVVVESLGKNGEHEGASSRDSKSMTEGRERDMYGDETPLHKPGMRVTEREM